MSTLWRTLLSQFVSSSLSFCKLSLSWFLAHILTAKRPNTAQVSVKLLALETNQRYHMHSYFKSRLPRALGVCVLLCTSLLFEGHRCHDFPILFCFEMHSQHDLLWPVDHRKSHRHPEEFRPSPGCGGKEHYQELAASNDAFRRTSLTHLSDLGALIVKDAIIIIIIIHKIIVIFFTSSTLRSSMVLVVWWLSLNLFCHALPLDVKMQSLSDHYVIVSTPSEYVYIWSVGFPKPKSFANYVQNQVWKLL